MEFVYGGKQVWISVIENYEEPWLQHGGNILKFWNQKSAYFSIVSVERAFPGLSNTFVTRFFENKQKKIK